MKIWGYFISLILCFSSSEVFAEKKNWKKVRKKYVKKRSLKNPKEDFEKVNSKLIPLTNAIYLCRKKNPNIRGKALKTCIEKMRRL